MRSRTIKRNKTQCTYVFRHLQHSEHKEDVLLAVLELLVFKVSIDLAISQGELFGQVFEVRCDIGFGFCVPLEAKTSARSVYLFQQLQLKKKKKQTVDKVGRHVPHENKSTLTESVSL